MPTHNGSVVLPEIRVTPNRNYVYDSYDGNELEFANGGHLFAKGGNTGTHIAGQGWYTDLLNKYGAEYNAWKKENPNGTVKDFARSKGYYNPINNVLDRSNVPGMTPYTSNTINNSVASYPYEEATKKRVKQLQEEAQKNYEWERANTPQILKAYDEKEHNGTYEQRMNYAEGLANAEKDRKINEGTTNMMFQLPFWVTAPELMAAYTAVDEAGTFAGDHDKTTSQWINQAMLGEGHDNNILGPIVLGGGINGLRSVGKTATKSVANNTALRNAFNTSDFAMANDLHFTPTGTLKQGTKVVDLGTGKVQKPTTLKKVTDPVTGREVKPKTLLHNMQKSPEAYLDFYSGQRQGGMNWWQGQTAQRFNEPFRLGNSNPLNNPLPERPLELPYQDVIGLPYNQPLGQIKIGNSLKNLKHKVFEMPLITTPSGRMNAYELPHTIQQDPTFIRDNNILKTLTGGKYTYNDIVKDGKLMPFLFDKVKTSAHGEFIRMEDDLTTFYSKLKNAFNTQESRKVMANIARSNPTGRSGIYVDTHNNDLSIDSHPLALHYMEKLGSNFIPIKTADEYVILNPFGVKGLFPAKSNITKSFTMGVEPKFVSFNGNRVGLRFTNDNEELTVPMNTPDEILENINKGIFRFNEHFGTSYPPAQFNPLGINSRIYGYEGPYEIQVPNIHGVLFKTGGKI